MGCLQSVSEKSCKDHSAVGDRQYQTSLNSIESIFDIGVLPSGIPSSSKRKILLGVLLFIGRDCTLIY